MNSEEAEETSRISRGIVKPQKRHVLILVILVHGPFRSRVSEVGRGRAVQICIEYGRIAETQLSRLETRVRPLHS